jgi:hypothetical protein
MQWGLDKTGMKGEWLAANAEARTLRSFEMAHRASPGTTYLNR